MALPQALQYIEGLLLVGYDDSGQKVSVRRHPAGVILDTPLSFGGAPFRLRYCWHWSRLRLRISLSPGRASGAGRTFPQRTDWPFAAIRDRAPGCPPPFRKPWPLPDSFFRSAANRPD